MILNNSKIWKHRTWFNSRRSRLCWSSRNIWEVSKNSYSCNSRNRSKRWEKI